LVLEVQPTRPLTLTRRFGKKVGRGFFVAVSLKLPILRENYDELAKEGILPHSIDRKGLLNWWVERDLSIR